MDNWRVAVACLAVGLVLFSAGMFVGGGGKETGRCYTYSGGGFEQIGPTGIIWNDGCNDHYFPPLAVLGGIPILAGVALSGAVVLQRFR